MNYSIQRLSEDFDIFQIKNFKIYQEEEKQNLIELVLKCKERNHFGGGGSFPVDRDYCNFFNNLYQEFFNVSSELLGSFTSIEKPNKIWSYSSNKYDHGPIPGVIHNHKDTSTINSVYYLNVPSSITEEQGSISFFLQDKIFTYKPEYGDLLIFPDYLDHRINNYDTDEEWRISINMEILCEETSDELFGRIN